MLPPAAGYAVGDSLPYLDGATIEDGDRLTAYPYLCDALCTNPQHDSLLLGKKVDLSCLAFAVGD